MHLMIIAAVILSIFTVIGHPLKRAVTGGIESGLLILGITADLNFRQQLVPNRFCLFCEDGHRFSMPADFFLVAFLRLFKRNKGNRTVKLCGPFKRHQNSGLVRH